MRYKTVHDVLDWVKTVHSQLRKVYEYASGETQDQRTAMLLDYLAQHEAMLVKAMARYDRDAGKDVLETWCDYNPQFPLPTEPGQLKAELDGLSTADVIDHYLRCHERLVDLYKQLAGEADTPEIEEIFSNLAQLEMREIERSVRDADRLEDI